MCRDNNRKAASTFERQYGSDVPESTCCHFPFTESTLADPCFAVDQTSSASFGVGTMVSSAIERNNSCVVEELASSLEESNSYTSVASAFTPPRNGLVNSVSSLVGGMRPWTTTVASSNGNRHHNSSSSPLSPQNKPCVATHEQQPCPSPGEACNAMALRTLRNIHVVADECLSSTDDGGQGQQQLRPRDQARETGTVLSQLEDGLAAATSILSCGRCGMRPQLQLLVATILEMLVQWCGAVVRSRTPATTATDARAFAPDPSCRGRGELVCAQPVTIGAYQLDRGLEVPVVAHVVMEKLHRLEGLLERLLARMEESNMAVGSKNGHSPATFSLREVGLLEIIRERLVDCLRCQVGMVRDDAVRLQRSSVGV
ncbi:hypothetical protein F5883DRAFT_650062 [Diaporthe sp. PMI_573]|nr:hypothetical protein F5883DRAFT_650062 [Diaporthaceae sp. PMI_573]